MTDHTDRALEEGSTVASLVANYLREHPRFLLEYPELLADIEIAHAAGPVASLLERQVAVLRHRYRRLQNQYREVLSIARDNDGLSQRLHQLGLRLVGAADATDILEALYSSLRQDFQAEFVSLRLFAAPKDGACASLPEFAGVRCAERDFFHDVLSGAQPTCGRFEAAQAQFLFGEAATNVGSGVIVPLCAQSWSGVLAVGCRDTRRYYAGMGVDLMTHLGDMTALALNPWIRA
jgi:uncharacterized protein YigA (DUF484 family)